LEIYKDSGGGGFFVQKNEPEEQKEYIDKNLEKCINITGTMCHF